MKFPERLYYPIYKAVKIINNAIEDNRYHIDIDDLLYFANIGELELCYYFSMRGGNDCVGEISINAYGDEKVDLLANIMPDKDSFDLLKTEYGIIVCDLYKVNKEAAQLYG